jgi:multidrug efflux system outer membrane protein
MGQRRPPSADTALPSDGRDDHAPWLHGKSLDNNPAHHKPGSALSDLFTGPARVWQFGSRITIPIFNAGKITNQVRAAEARTEQALVQYQQAVQQAFREVEDTLVGHRKVREIRPELEALVEANRRSLQIADLRYRDGLSSYLDVLDAQR